MNYNFGFSNIAIAMNSALAQAFRVRRVPCLVVLRTNGDIVSLDFTASLERLKTDSWKRWVGEHVIDRMPLYMLSIENVD